MAVDVVERFLIKNKSQCMDCPAVQKKETVVERWPSVSTGNTHNGLACARKGTKLLPGLDYICNTG